MRIIAGLHRGRTILGPKDATTTRPITDRVKTSLFDRLWAMGMLGEGHVLDIFAGTGSLGLEALSRGADRVTFIEQDREALRRLEQNLATLDLADRARVVRGSALRPGWPRQIVREPARLIFLDPPYAMLRDAASVDRLADLARELADVAEPEAVLVMRLEKRTDPPALPGWAPPDTYGYGSMKLSFYGRG